MNIRNAKIILILFCCTQLILPSDVQPQSSINCKKSILWGMILGIGGISAYYGVKRLWNSGYGRDAATAVQKFAERFEHSDDEKREVFPAPPPVEQSASSLGSSSRKVPNGGKNTSKTYVGGSANGNVETRATRHSVAVTHVEGRGSGGSCNIATNHSVSMQSSGDGAILLNGQPVTAESRKKFQEFFKQYN